ncbi:hypothetical protein [Cellulomonas triticagri]|uniref:Uncharacterized protein n=1 Tax=Cellulomonas triticagri TaxID=2483352 RepID=A0A3M2JN31_9CELL|nr:hypothetical protein [Cellulomonas triticagri]RMI13220.1 hypothetical protein EBM89_05185 [Cellulomonas triticagri]
MTHHLAPATRTRDLQQIGARDRHLVLEIEEVHTLAGPEHRRGRDIVEVWCRVGRRPASRRLAELLDDVAPAGVDPSDGWPR